MKTVFEIIEYAKKELGPAGANVLSNDMVKLLQKAAIVSMTAMQRECAEILNKMIEANLATNPDEFLKKTIDDELTIALSRILRIETEKL